MNKNLKTNQKIERLVYIRKKEIALKLTNCAFVKSFSKDKKLTFDPKIS